GSGRPAARRVGRRGRVLRPKSLHARLWAAVRRDAGAVPRHAPLIPRRHARYKTRPVPPLYRRAGHRGEGGNVKSIALLAVVGERSVVGAAFAGAGGPSATGGSHLVAHNVFGLQTLELQDFGFNAKVKVDGGADGWFTYRDVEDGVPFSTN